MTLQEFIQKYDKPGAVVLLEGKRTVPDADQQKLTALGTLLVTHTKHMLFRSGNAAGADQYFSDGVTAIDKQRLEVITPYTAHRKKTNQAYTTHSLDDMDMLAEPEVVYQSKGNKKTEKLIDQFVEGVHNRNTIKAAYIIRDTVKAIGTSTIPPASFAIFYDDLANPQTGGTGHTMQVCINNNIPIIDQRIWMHWLI